MSLSIAAKLPDVTRLSLGGGYKTSAGWEPLGPVGYYDTFGPELSFGRTLRRGGVKAVAIAKFTHSGSQVIDWTPEGSEAKSRNLYRKFIKFVALSVAELRTTPALIPTIPPGAAKALIKESFTTKSTQF